MTVRAHSRCGRTFVEEGGFCEPLADSEVDPQKWGNLTYPGPFSSCLEAVSDPSLLSNERDEAVCFVALRNWEAMGQEDSQVKTDARKAARLL